MTSTNRRAFGRAEVRLDPWQPEFGAEFSALGSVADESSENVDTEAEYAKADWRPLDGPAGLPAWETGACFVDGVRRLEARVTAKLDGKYFYGAFGAFAVGAVELNAEHASFERYITGRVFALNTADQPEGEISVAPGLTYLPLRILDTEIGRAHV